MSLDIIKKTELSKTKVAETIGYPSCCPGDTKVKESVCDVVQLDDYDNVTVILVYLIVSFG